MTYDGAANVIMLGLLIITLIFINRSALRDNAEHHIEFQEKILTVDEARMETAELRKREPKEAPAEPKYTSLGTYRITVYTPYDGGGESYITKSGERAEHLATCAVDPSIIPLGSLIEVGGFPLRANDTGSAVKGNVIDIFYDGRPKDAIAWIAKFGTVHEVLVEAMK